MKVVTVDGIVKLQLNKKEKDIISMAINHDDELEMLFEDFPILADSRWFRSKYSKGRWEYKPTSWLRLSLR